MDNTYEAHDAVRAMGVVALAALVFAAVKTPLALAALLAGTGAVAYGALRILLALFGV